MMNKRFYLFGICLVLFLFVSYYYLSNNKHDETEKKIEIGILQLLNHEALDTIYKGIVEELKREGYVDGENIKITLKNAQGDQSNLSIMSEQLVKDKSDILVGITTVSTISLSKATKDIPIIMAGISYPVESGLIKDEKSSGNNITGVSDRTPLKQQLDLMKQILPNMKKLGILFTVGEDNSTRQSKEMEEIAKAENLEVIIKSVVNTNDINQSAEFLAKEVDAIFIPIDNNIASAMPTLISATDKEKIPVFPSADSMVKDGGLLAIGVDQYKIGTETAKIILRVIKGEKPTNIPIIFENKGTVYLNESKARELNIRIPNQIKNNVTVVK